MNRSLYPSLNNIALKRAINARNLNEAQRLIADGADINHKVNPYLDTMLHKAINADIARDLLYFNADTDAENIYKQTPLHSAVIEGKIAVLKTLLAGLAYVEARDSKGFTPLYYAVKSKNVEAIKYLVIYSANINFKPNACLHFNGPPILNIAMLQDDLTSIKVLIKYAVYRRNRGTYPMDIDLRPCYGMKNFNLASTYKYDCDDEMFRMRMENLTDEITLFQMIMTVPSHFSCTDPEGTEFFTRRSFEVLTGNKYPVYRDVIIEKLRDKLKVSCLKNMLCFLQISTVSTDSNEKEPTTLNQDINSVLAKYLSKNDLFNLILASSEPSMYQINPIKSYLKKSLVLKPVRDRFSAGLTADMILTDPPLSLKSSKF